MEIKEKTKFVSVLRMSSLNKPEIPLLVIGTLGAVIHGVLFPILGLLLSTAIKIFYSKFWAGISVVFGVITLVVVPLQHYFFGVAGEKLIRRIRSLTFEKVLRQEISWFDDPRHSSGALGARLSTDALMVKSLVGDMLAQVVQNLTTVIAALVISFTANWILAIVTLTLFPVVCLQTFFQTKFLKGFSKDAKLKYEEASQVANDAVGSIRTVASFCAESKVTKMYEKKCEGLMKHGARIGLVNALGFGFSNIATHCTFALCFYVGSLLIQHKLATFTELFKVFFSLWISAMVIAGNYYVSDANKARDAATSIFEIIDRKPKIDSSSDEGTTLENVQGDIEFKHVSFKYPTRPDNQIFYDLSLTIPSGKTVALVGESGGGKSTVISLIERFYDPDSGQIFLDGVEIKLFKLKWLRQQIGLVSQEPILFNESIRANIAYGKEGGASEEEIIEAAKASNVLGRYLCCLRCHYFGSGTAATLFLRSCG